ncbi:MAG TPA: serine hydrolase domain-containing protein, partial [Allosphingosinicella sp.]
MTGSRITAAAAAMLLAAEAPAQTLPATADQVFSRWSSPGGPGCAVGVAQEGRPVLTRAYGSADLEHRAPNRPDTVFEAGSVSKQFTAAAVLLLAQEGRLSLGDDVRRHVPELPDYGRTITIDHLLSHTSGLREWSALVAAAGWPRMTRVHDDEDALDAIFRQRALNHGPGDEYSYTNSGYVLLALIVRRVSGMSLADYTGMRLFIPLGMTATRWRDDFRRIEPGRAIAYQRAEGGGGWEQAMPFEELYGPGGLLTTVGDLLIWNEVLASGRLGAAVGERMEEQARLTDGRAIAYARGVSVGSFRGTREVSHSGSTAGYRAWLGRFPAERLSIAVLCNAAQADASGLAYTLAGRLLDDAAPGPAAAAVDAGDLSGRAGLYVNQRTGRPLRLELREGRLRVADGPELRA